MNGLRTADLIAERNRLEDLISKHQKALDAVKTMIEYREATGADANVETDSSEKAHNHRASGQINLRQECIRFVNQMNNRWFGTKDIVEMFFASGIRKRKEINQVRPLVSTYLAQFTKQGILIKKPVGDGKRIEFRFQRITGNG